MATTDVLALFESARDVLLIPGVWTKGTMARNELGEDVYFDDPSACQFCLLGAVYAAAGEENTDLHEELWAYTGVSVEAFNDNPITVLEDVIDVLEGVIRELRR